MHWLSRKDFIFFFLFFLVAAIVCGLLSEFVGASWIRSVIGFTLMTFPVLLIHKFAQKRKHEREAERKPLKPDNSSTHTTQPNTVGKVLVAQQRSDFFFNLRMWGIGILFGCLAGFTISGFWSGLLNRCSACGQFDAEKVHQLSSPNNTIYYNCPGTEAKQFSVAKPQRDTFTISPDDR